MDIYDTQYYKVVRKHGGQLVSSMSMLGLARVVYAPGEWVSAPQELSAIEHDLCVIAPLARAQALAFGNYFQVWECECEGLHMPTRWGTMSSFARARSINRAIRKEFVSSARAKEHELWGWPLNTMMAKRVKLTKRVE